MHKRAHSQSSERPKNRAVPSKISRGSSISFQPRRQLLDHGDEGVVSRLRGEGAEEPHLVHLEVGDGQTELIVKQYKEGNLSATKAWKLSGLQFDEFMSLAKD